MHILMMTASLPYPPHQGGAIRAWGILQGLHKAGHRVTLLSFASEEQSQLIAETPLNAVCEQVITVVPPVRSISQRLRDVAFTSYADIARRLESEAMHNCLKQLMRANSFDLVQFEGIEITNYLFAVRKENPDVPVIYDAFNAEAALQQVIAQVDRQNLKRLPSAVYSYIQARRIDQYERAICEQANAVIAVSNEDADLLRNYKADYVYVVPSGVFFDDYVKQDNQIDLKPNALVFTGKMDYRPNVDAMTWFAGRVLPLVQREIEVNLYIVGQKPHPRLDALRGNPAIEITAWVPEVQPYLHAADVYIAPLRMGSGTRLKLLEAMAAGCAIVATPTAASGLMQSAWEHMIITEDDKTMASAVSDLLQHPDKRRGLGNSARNYIQQHYDWSVLIPKLLNVYKDMGLG